MKQKSMKEQLIEDFEKEKQRMKTKPPSYLKAGMWMALGVGLIWGSKYIFKALAGAIEGFKELRKAIREK